LLGIVHTLFAEHLVRLGRLAEHCQGLAELEQAVGEFSADAMSSRCGIDAEEIRDLARQLARTERAAVYGRLGTCTQEYGTLASWLVDVINIVTGHLDEPGGAMFPKAAAFASNTSGPAGRGKGIVTGRRHSRISGAPEVYGELPMTCLAEEIETPGAGQIRALFTLASNPVLSSPGGARIAAALEQLEFMVSLDIYVNETTRHADVILPGLSALQDLHFDPVFPQLADRNNARFSAPVLPAPAGHPAEWQTLLRLIAIVQGMGAAADIDQLDDQLTAEDVRRAAGGFADPILAAVAHRRGPERLIDLALRGGPYGDQFGRHPGGLTLDHVQATPAGIDLGALTSRIPELLRTPSGKIELAPAMLIADLRRVAADCERPVPDLVVIGRRQLRSNNSWMHNLPSLAKGKARCTALVHPADAARLGLRDGGRAQLRRVADAAGAPSTAAIAVDIEISDEMMPGVVSLPHGWGHDVPGTRLSVAGLRPGVNLNAVTDDRRRDPLSGNAVLNGIAIQLSPML
jgi:anaerobic selenocysteine-containing dehydrogenase